MPEPTVSTFNPAVPTNPASPPPLAYLSFLGSSYRVYNCDYDIGFGVGNPATGKSTSGVPSLSGVFAKKPGDILGIREGQTITAVLTLADERTVRCYSMTVDYLAQTKDTFALRITGPFGSVRVG